MWLMHRAVRGVSQCISVYLLRVSTCIYVCACLAADGGMYLIEGLAAVIAGRYERYVDRLRLEVGFNCHGQLGLVQFE